MTAPRTPRAARTPWRTLLLLGVPAATFVWAISEMAPPPGLQMVELPERFAKLSFEQASGHAFPDGGDPRPPGASQRAERAMGAARHKASIERTRDAGENPMTPTERDPQSTFAVDVDTASYTLARSKLLRGELPPAAAIRVEEFVNFLPYDYQGPTNGAPFAVNMEGAPHPWQPGHHIVRVGVQGAELDHHQRPPVHLSFLVDTSGSMAAADKLPLAQDAMAWLVDHLGPEDTVAIATYAGRAQRVLPPTPTTRRGAILAAIQGLSAGGGTHMSGGMDLAYEMAADAYAEGAENRVVVLSDGDANIGARSHEQILAGIRAHADRGITMTTVGLGSGSYNDLMMEKLANNGDGNYYFVDSEQEARRIFGTALGGTIHTIARDVKVQVDFDPALVMAHRLIGYENRDIPDADFRDDAVDAGEIGSGHQVTALYDVVLRDHWAQVDERPLATVRLRAKPPGADAPAREWHTQLAARLVLPAFGDASRDTRMAVATAAFALKLRDADQVAELEWAQIADMVRSARRRTSPSDAELTDLVYRAASLNEDGIAMR